jgi:hypothetical protein
MGQLFLFEQLAWLDGEKVRFLPVLACFWPKTSRLDDLPVRINDLLARLVRPAVRLGASAGRIIRPAAWSKEPAGWLPALAVRLIEPAVWINPSAIRLAEPTVRLATSARLVNDATVWLEDLTAPGTASAAKIIRPSALRGCAVARLRGCAVARLRGCAVARLRGCAVENISGNFHSKPTKASSKRRQWQHIHCHLLIIFCPELTAVLGRQDA